MPVYDYLCEQCGPFTLMRPMAECELGSACPECGADSPRAFLRAPYFSTMSVERRLAHATNEQSANAPRTLGQTKAMHSKGCSCCSGTASRKLKRDMAGADNAAKSFPAKRPWMISH